MSSRKGLLLRTVTVKYRLRPARQRSERTRRLIEQLELELEELVTSASEDELASAAAAAKTHKVRAFERKRPVRKPWPDDIERERVVIAAPSTCGHAGILQVDCYSGLNALFDERRKDQPLTPAFCFAHARRGFFELADIEKNAREGKRNGKPISPIALEAVKRLDALFEIEREINGKTAAERRAVRQQMSKPLFDDMHAWLLRERETLSRSSDVLKPMNYMLSRWTDFARFLDDGRICLSNNAAERGLRGIALGRRNWTFAGSLRGADRTAVMSTMIKTCRLNDVDPKAWLADVLARTANLPTSRLHELLPWEWKRPREPEKPADQQAA